MDTIILISNLGPRFELGPETIRRWDEGQGDGVRVQ
jgi:hypothetical protein